MYGESVDKVIQGNTENIVFLKSTDDAMIDTLVKISGTTHESRIDQKTITKDNERLFNQHEGRISYTMSTKERPVIQFNDFLFIQERNSIVLKAGSSPIWNRRETAYPMSWRLFQNTLNIPGKEFTLQTIPTNSSAKDFDVRKNQPDFFAMVNQRKEQAKRVKDKTKAYKEVYGLTDADFIRLDHNVVADDIMDAVNRSIQKDIKEEAEMSRMISEGEVVEMTIDEFGMPIEQTQSMVDSSEENTELEQAVAVNEAILNEEQMKRYAGGLLSREDIKSGQLNNVLSRAYKDVINYFKNDNDFHVDTDTNELLSRDGILYVKSTKGRIRDDVEQLQEASEDELSRVYSEDDIRDVEYYELTKDFIDYLIRLDSWHEIIDGHFDHAVKREYELHIES